MPKKENNDRKYPGGKSPRPDLTEIKRTEAKERQDHYSALSLAEKIALLDHPRPASNAEKCGGEAKKQRDRLASLLEKKNTVPAAVVEVVSEESNDSEKKHMKAKERRRKEQKKD